MEGGGKHPPPPSATTRQKSPVLIGLTVFAIILTEPYSSSSTIYPQQAFAPEDNQQKYSEISQGKYHGSRHSPLSFVYKDLYLIVFEGNDLHLVDN